MRAATVLLAGLIATLSLGSAAAWTQNVGGNRVYVLEGHGGGGPGYATAGSTTGVDAAILVVLLVQERTWESEPTCGTDQTRESTSLEAPAVFASVTVGTVESSNTCNPAYQRLFGGATVCVAGCVDVGAGDTSPGVAGFDPADGFVNAGAGHPLGYAFVAQDKETRATGGGAEVDLVVERITVTEIAVRPGGGACAGLAGGIVEMSEVHSGTLTGSNSLCL